MSDQTTETATVVLEGRISVTAALTGGSRRVSQVLVERGRSGRELARLLQAAARTGVDVRRAAASEIETYAAGASHGGVIALAGERQFQRVEDLAVAPDAFIVMLDGVEDPYNFGQAVRAAYAAGATGLVVRPRNWFTAAGLVARASAGATELIPTAVVETPLAAAQVFRQRGITIACTSHRRAASLYHADLRGPLFVLVGGERRGVTRSFRDQADLALTIPYGRSFGHSLGTAAAAAVLSFEVMRQRRSAPPPVFGIFSEKSS